MPQIRSHISRISPYSRAASAARLPPRRLLGAAGLALTIGRPQVRIDTSDPFLPTKMPGVREAWRTQTRTVLLRSGAFAGQSAHIVVDPLQWPHLWVKKGVYVTTVSGDLSADEMVRIAESVGPWQGQ